MKNGVSYPLEAQNQACSVDYAEMLGSKFSMKNACFTSAADLSQLPEGDYRLYLDISAEGYRDIYEMTDIYSRAIETVTVDDRSYALFISPVRYRMVLSITQNGPNTDGGDDKAIHRQRMPCRHPSCRLKISRSKFRGQVRWLFQHRALHRAGKITKTKHLLNK